MVVVTGEGGDPGSPRPGAEDRRRTPLTRLGSVARIGSHP